MVDRPLSFCSQNTKAVFPLTGSATTTASRALELIDCIRSSETFFSSPSRREDQTTMDPSAVDVIHGCSTSPISCSSEPSFVATNISRPRRHTVDTKPSASSARLGTRNATVGLLKPFPLSLDCNGKFLHPSQTPSEPLHLARPMLVAFPWIQANYRS